MTTKKTPTLTDVYRKLGEQDAKLEQIHKQVKDTNGRVSSLEADKTRRDWETQYRKENPQQSAQEVKEGWSTREKQLIAFITALLAILTTLVGTGRI